MRTAPHRGARPAWPPRAQGGLRCARGPAPGVPRGRAERLAAARPGERRLPPERWPPTAGAPAPETTRGERSEAGPPVVGVATAWGHARRCRGLRGRAGGGLSHRHAVWTWRPHLGGALHQACVVSAPLDVAPRLAGRPRGAAAGSAWTRPPVGPRGARAAPGGPDGGPRLRGPRVARAQATRSGEPWRMSRDAAARQAWQGALPRRLPPRAG